MRSILPLFGLLLSLASYAQKELPEHIKINQIQVLGTHNSYAQPVDTTLMNAVGPMIDQAQKGYLQKMPAEQLKFFKEYHPNEVTMKEGLNYNHPSFEVQLNAGLRSLEMDVYYDPQGGRFLKPAGYEMLKQKGVTQLAPHDTGELDLPGFKVLHIADLDFRSQYPNFKKALTAIKTWSDQNPEHIPLFIMIEAKDSAIPLFPQATQVLTYDEKAFDALDQEILEIIGRDKIITPDDVRKGYKTLREAVLAQKWPALQASKGKILFLLVPSAAGASQTPSPYVANRPNLENRLMFIQSKPEDSYGAFLLLDNAIVRQEEIKALVKKGYLVRTRSDIETYEAKVNDKTRANAAFSSGAQVISTDFFRKGNTYNTDYFVEIPGGNPVRVNPVNN